MARQIKIALETARLDRLRRELEPRAHAILDKAAFSIEATAKPQTNVDTGALRSSGYVSGASGGGGSTYSAGASEAEARRPGVNLLPEEKPRNEFERVIGFSVEYAIWQEFKHKAFLVPAVEAERPKLTAAWKQLFEV